MVFSTASIPVRRGYTDAYRYPLARVFTGLCIEGLSVITVFYMIARDLLLLFIPVNRLATPHVIDHWPVTGMRGIVLMPD